MRLLARLFANRGLMAAVCTLALASAAIDVIVPRLLGHATDLLFTGAIGRRLPAGMTKEQAVAAANARGDSTFAHMLSKMDLTPGVGIDFIAVGHTVLVAAALYVVVALLVSLQAQLLKVAIQRMMEALRAELEAKLHRLRLSYINARQHGELLGRLTNDIDNIQAALKQTASALPTTLLTAVAVLVIMLTISGLLAAITMLTVPISALASRLILRRSKRLRVARAADSGRLNAAIEEIYSGLAVVKAFGHQQHVREQLAQINCDVYRAGVGAQFTSGLISPATTFVGNLGYLAVAVVGALQVATGKVSLGGVQAFVQYVRQFNQPVTDIATRYDMLQAGLASAERVFELLDAPEQAADVAPELSEHGDAMGGRVEFERVDFCYQPEKRVIGDLSLVAEPGTTVAIVGPTGAGKSTLVNLLMRFYEVDSGRILIDGVDIATVDREWLCSRVGMVLQDTWLFAGSIADNIGYGCPGATREQIIEVAKTTGVDQFVRAMSDGYDTWVSEDGGNLSAGEKQLITIARALLARPQFLVLDEATGSLDTRSEDLVQRAMAELRRGRTCFVIAHRLSTIRDADLIVVMDGGRVVEQGTHQQLVARGGIYCQLTRAAGLSPVASPADAGTPCEGMHRYQEGRAGEPHRPELRPLRGPSRRPSSAGGHAADRPLTRPASRSASPHIGIGDSSRRRT
nr:ABC transporter ATP-binding protein [Mycobacterium basiliense]